MRRKRKNYGRKKERKKDHKEKNERKMWKKDRSEEAPTRHAVGFDVTRYIPQNALPKKLWSITRRNSIN